MTPIDTAARLISRADLARILNISVRTLENWERQGYGPRPVRLGRSVRYAELDVNAFVIGLTTKAAS